MVARIHTSAPLGLNGVKVEIECDLTNGLPGITVVGLGAKAVDESRERVKSALMNSGLKLPRKRITINLSPADLPKDGASYDLPIAVAILAASGQIGSSPKDSAFVGELALDGRIHPVPGVIVHVQSAKEQGLKRVFVPKANALQAALVGGIDILPVSNLKQVYRHLNDMEPLGAQPITDVDDSQSMPEIDFCEVNGQALAKRALEIAAAGHHNVLMTGPPGTGKTMLAKAINGLLPPLERSDIIILTHLYSLAKLSADVIYRRPFRSPHHTSSPIALIGGGQNALPGEISLAHRGILFMDELPEYPRSVLESLRQPLEDGVVAISRANRRLQYPADFMLIATQNPCPCGYYGDTQRECVCTPYQVNQYQKRVSGPLLDRIDMVVNVERISSRELLETSPDQRDSATIRKAVIKARHIQWQRNDGRTNSQLNGRELKSKHLKEDTKALLAQAVDRINLSPRAAIRALKVARTIADLENSTDITVNHLSEALQYRVRQEALV